MAGVMAGAISGGGQEPLAAGIDLLYREGMLLDERRWDEWLDLFAEDCEIWMPMWRTEEELNSDPHLELSHLYYPSRAGLEERIVRIRSRRSPASVPLARTTHMLGNVIALDPPLPDTLRLRSAWTCQVFFPRPKIQHAFFGNSEHLLGFRDGRWRIAKKRIVLQNDYIPSMLDVYCI